MKPRHLIVLLLMGVLSAPWPLSAQEEVTSSIHRYRQREMSTGYYEEYEVKPRSYQPFIRDPAIRKTLVSLSPSAEKVRVRGLLADSHSGIEFYAGRTCVECHPREATDVHTVKAKITCRQCHGGEPIASMNHYYSLMNPIRRHAYVCAKCHQGASASYATYVVHEPNPAAAETAKTFPMLFYAFWIMVAIGVGTFVVFLPHTVLWGLRELFTKGKEHRESVSRKED